VKIFAAGIATETNTFCPVPTACQDFLVVRGDDSPEFRAKYSCLDLAQFWGRQAKERGDELVFSLNASAQPAGITIQSAYETLRDELLDELRAAMPVDIVLLMLHGAMVAHGYESCEEDIIRRVRQIVGRDAVIGVELDLHCHLRESTIASADIVITFKEYPHVDVRERAQELFDLAVATKLGTVRPTMALFDCKMTGMYPTSRQPLRGFVDSMIDAERRKEALSVSFGHGFQFGDVASCGAKVLVVTDNDSLAAARLAEKLGKQVHAMRREIGFDTLSLPMEEALSKALASSKTPVVVADQSDNCGAGAPGDSTFVLRWLLDHQVPDAALAIFYDPEVVKIASRAGIGAVLPVRLGGKMGAASGNPVDITVTVHAMLRDYSHELPSQPGSKPLSIPIGDVVALRCGSIDIVVGNERCQCFSPSIFRDLGIDPTRKRLLVPKSYQHFQSGFAPIAGEMMYMATPGAAPPNPKLLTYRHLKTHDRFPWVEDPFAKDR
jgi:microcystin degradation protein MlrC